MTDCALPCFMFTCVPSGNVKLIPDIGSAASAKPSAPSAITGRNIEPVVSEDGSSRSYLALFWDSRICLFASPTLSPRACIHLVMPRWYTWISLRKEVRRTFESWLSRTRYFFHAHSYRSSAVILLKILIWRQRYNDKRTCTRLHRGYAYDGIPLICKPSRQLADNREIVNCLFVRILRQKNRWSDSFSQFLVLLRIKRHLQLLLISINIDQFRQRVS